LGERFGELVACNGAGRSALLRQIIADALELPLSWSPGGDGTVAGAAMLGALGVGALSDENHLRAWARGSKHVERHVPDPRSGAKLRDVFARRAALYEAVRFRPGSAGA
jgi:sugar (pentulose or hexulose) kinase